MRQVIPFSKNIEFKSMISEITNISLEHTLSLKDKYNINGDFIITGKYKRNTTSTQEEDFSYKIPIDIMIDSKYKTDDIELEIDDFKYEKVEGNKLKVDIDLSIDNLEQEEKEIESVDATRDEVSEEEKMTEEICNESFCEEEPNALEDVGEDRKILTDEEKEQIEEIISGEESVDLFKEFPTEQQVVIDKEETKEETKEEPKEESKTKAAVGSLFTAFKDTEETFSTYSVYIIRDGDNIEDIMTKYKTTREALEEYNDMSNIKIGTKLIIPNTKDENDK